MTTTQPPPDLGESWRLNEAHCSECGKMVDGATKAMGDEEGAPEPGALSICMYCYAVNQYVAGEENELKLVAFDTSTLPLEERKEIQRLRLFLANHPSLD